MEQCQVAVQTNGDNEKIGNIDGQHQDSLPAAETLVLKCGQYSDQCYQDGNRKIQIDVLVRNRQLSAIDKGTDCENQGGINDIGSDYIADGHGRLFFHKRGDGCDQLWQRGADGDNRNTDQGLRYAPGRRDPAAVIHQKLGTGNNTYGADDNPQDIQTYGFLSVLGAASSVSDTGRFFAERIFSIM